MGKANDTVSSEQARKQKIRAWWAWGIFFYIIIFGLAFGDDFDAPDDGGSPVSEGSSYSAFYEDGSNDIYIGSGSSSEEEIYYVVVAGESWCAIAERNGSTGSYLSSFNKKSIDYVLHPGDVIQLPSGWS